MIGAQLREGEVEGVGAEAVLVGIELDRAEPARVAQEHRAAVGERHPEAVPRGIGAVARVEQRIAGGFAVDEHPAAHAEVQAEHLRRSSAPVDAGSACRDGGARDERLAEQRGARAPAGVSPRLRNHASGA